MADVIIRNGRIIDGAGNPWYHGDVAVSGGVISAVGDVRESATDRHRRPGSLRLPRFY